MLHLDYVQRAKNPLGPDVAGKLHWLAADTLGCGYGKRYAEADLRRANVDPNDFIKNASDPSKMPETERIVVEFARKMTRAAKAVTDEEVARLLDLFGPEKVVAMVHALAWANFQNRVVIGLGIQVEPDGPLPPSDPQFDKAELAKQIAPARPPWKQVQQAKVSLAAIPRLDWQEHSGTELACAVELQKSRQPRIPMLDPSRLAGLPPEVKARALKVAWSNVSMGYQPLLTQSWFETMGLFQQEAQLDSVFSNSMFWIITRSNECFY
jgi:hypothetical protein